MAEKEPKGDAGNGSKGRQVASYSFFIYVAQLSPKELHRCTILQQARPDRFPCPLIAWWALLQTSYTLGAERGKRKYWSDIHMTSVIQRGINNSHVSAIICRKYWEVHKSRKNQSSKYNLLTSIRIRHSFNGVPADKDKGYKNVVIIIFLSNQPLNQHRIV